MNRTITQLFLFILLGFGALPASAQSNVGINETGALPDASAILDVNSNTKGMLIPRLSKAQKALVASPANGLMIYQTDDTMGIWVYETNKWVPLMRSITTGPGLSGGYIQGKGIIGLNNTGVVAKKYGALDSIPVFTVNAQGQIVSASSIGTKFLNQSDTFNDWRIIGNKGTDEKKHFLGTRDNQALRFKLNNTWAGEMNPTNNNYTFGLNANPNSNGSYNIALGKSALENAANNKSSNIAIGEYTLSDNGVGAAGSWQGAENIAIGTNSMNTNRSGSYNVGIGSRTLKSGTFNYGSVAIGYEAMTSANNSYYNVAIGMNTLASTTGSYNVGIGYYSLAYNSSGYYNTGTGFYTLLYNNTGYGNSAYGMYAMTVNTTGYYNTAMGYQALYSSYASRQNTAVGAFAGVSTTNNGSYNTIIGYAALYSNSTGYSNTAVGIGALYSNTTKGNLVAVGDSALFNNGSSSSTSEAVRNTAIGSKGLQSNTRGYNNTVVGYQAAQSNIDGNFNTAMGALTLLKNNSGNKNTAMGNEAMYSNSSGSDNTAIGCNALNTNTTGTGNSSMGYLSGNSNTTGTYNTFIGYDADANLSSASNSTAIGNLSTVTASNQVRLGSSSVVSIGGFVSWTNLSDGRVKKQIKNNVPGLEFILKLEPVTYEFDFQQIDEKLGLDKTSGDASNTINRSTALNNPNQNKRFSGFIAQDVEKAAESIGYEFSGVDKAQNKNDLYGLRYSEFVVPMVKAIQEQQSQIELLKEQNAQLLKMIQELQKANK